MSGPETVCTWPSCKCTARDQCKGLGIRADLPPTLSACLAHPEVKALVEAAQIAIDVMEWVGGENDCTRGIDALEAALARIKDTAP
jgi:hypothetical protein